MGVKLPSGFTYTCALITVLLSICFSVSAKAQVALTDANLFQITFSLDESIAEEGRATLSLSDISGDDTPVAFQNLSGRTLQSDLPEHFYLNLPNGRVAVSSLNPANMMGDERVIAYLPVINETGSELSGFSSAFDFLYLPARESSSTIKLQVRTGERPWQDVPGSSIRYSDLADYESDEWQSFSVQSSIDNVYIRPGDLIEFRWIEEMPSIRNEVFPLAIQGIELSAETAATVFTEKGSLVITEIYSGSGGSEYIELYNPTGSALPLSGLTVRSGDRSMVVQHDVVVPPYSYFVLAESRFAPSIESVPGYVYYGELLNGSSGFVELLHGDNEVARAAFDFSDSRSSVELDRTINGFDGYSSLQNFLPSNTDLGSGISGSPGTSGNSRRHFIRSMNGQSPKLMSFPGFLPSSQNRSLVGELEIRNLRGEAVNPNDALPGEPYLLRYNGESSLRLYAEEIASAFGSDRPMKVSADDSPFSYLTLPASAGLTLSGLLNEFNQPIVPAAQVWNEETRRFDVIYSDAATLNSWDPLIVNSDIPRPQKAVAETETRIEPQRMITFSVFEEQGGNRESLIDQAYLSFMPDYWTSTGRRYDLPKLMPLPASDTDPLVEDRETSLFYIRNAESNLSVNSFTHLPYEPMSDYRLTADLLSTKGSMQTVLSWSLTDDIPDEWNIVLEDQLTGQRIDMREQTSYRYRHAASAPLEIDNAEEETEPIRMIDTGLPSEDRFTILISPYESPLGLQEDAEQPGSVELRQNYPNPFNPTTNIVYFLPDDRQIRIGVYNVVGQQVATLVDEAMSAGEHTATWNASDMPSGIYIVQLESGNQVFTRKITLIK